MGIENSMEKVRTTSSQRSPNGDYKPSAPADYTPPTPVRVPLPTRKVQ